MNPCLRPQSRQDNKACSRGADANALVALDGHAALAAEVLEKREERPSRRRPRTAESCPRPPRLSTARFCSPRRTEASSRGSENPFLLRPGHHVRDELETPPAQLGRDMAWVEREPCTLRRIQDRDGFPGVDEHATARHKHKPRSLLQKPIGKQNGVLQIRDLKQHGCNPR